MKPHTQNPFLLLSIWMSLWCSTVSAAPTDSNTTDNIHHYYSDPNDPEGRTFHRFLPTPAPKDLFYDTRMKATANIDDTPEHETVVLMIVDTRKHIFTGNWTQAFLLIAENQPDEIKKKDIFKLYDTGRHELNIPAKTVEIHNPPFAFTKQPKGYQFHHAFFRLVDLTGDGILDIWIEFSNAISVISFQKGEFKVIFSSYANKFYRSSVDKYIHPEFVDMDNNGIYEIKTPCNILSIISRGWINLYEWDGTDYVLNNRRFYTTNENFLKDWLKAYNYYRKPEDKGFSFLFETCNFYIGLIYYYRDNIPLARKHLQWIIANSKKDEYIQAAKSILEKVQEVKKELN